MVRAGQQQLGHLGSSSFSTIDMLCDHGLALQPDCEPIIHSGEQLLSQAALATTMGLLTKLGNTLRSFWSSML